MGRITYFSISLTILIVVSIMLVLNVEFEYNENGDRNKAISEENLYDQTDIYEEISDFNEKSLGNNLDIDEPLKSDFSLLETLGISDHRKTNEKQIIVASGEVPVFGETTTQIEYVNSKIVTLETVTTVTYLASYYFVVGNITTQADEVITQSVGQTAYDSKIYLGFSGSMINRYGYNGTYKLSIAIYIPQEGNPEYQLVSSAIHVLGDWNYTDFVEPIADLFDYSILPIDGDNSGKYEKFYIDGQISIHDFTGDLSVVVVIYGTDSPYSIAYNQSIYSVSAYETLNFNFSLFNTLVYAMDEPKNLWWLIAFGAENRPYDIYYDRILVDPNTFDPPAVTFSMDHELMDTNSNSLYDILSGTYNITSIEANITYSIDINIQIENQYLASGYLSGLSIVGNEIRIMNISMESVGFSEYVGNVTINALMHIDVPIRINNEIQYTHLHIRKVSTIYVDYTQFDPSPLQMTILEYGGTDTDSDGLYNKFFIDFQFSLDPGFDSLYISVSLYDITDPNYSDFLDSYSYNLYDLVTWDGRANITIFANDFTYQETNNSLIEARIYVSANPKPDSSVNYFSGTRYIQEYFNTSQFDPPPVDILSVTDFLRDTDGNGKAEELVIKVEINITETMGSPSLDAYLLNSSGSSYLYFSPDVGTYFFEMNFTYLRIISSPYQNGRFEYRVRIYDYTLNGIQREFVGVTNLYSREQFEELPALIVPDSTSLNFVDSDGSGKYDIVKVSYLLNISKPAYYSIRSTSEAITQDNYYFGYQSNYTYLENVGIHQIQFEYEGWEIFKTRMNGNLTFTLTVRVYVNGTYYYLDPVQITESIVYLDFDPPNVYVDTTSNPITNEIDIDGNGLTDYLEVTIPIIIIQDTSIYYYAYLETETGYNLGYASATLELSKDNPVNLVVVYESGKINETGISGSWKVIVHIQDKSNWEEVDYVSVDIGTFDANKFDTWPIHFLDDININSYSLNVDGDLYQDWFVFEIDIFVRIPNNYFVEGYIYLYGENRNYLSGFHSVFSVNPTMTGTINVELKVPGYLIFDLNAAEVELYRIRLEDKNKDALDTYYAYNSVFVETTEYISSVNIIGTILFDGEFMNYNYEDPFDPGVVYQSEYQVSNYGFDQDLLIQEYTNGNPSADLLVNPYTRNYYSSYFFFHLDPNGLSLGIWFQSIIRTQIIGSTSMNVLGYNLDVWVASDGINVFYYDSGSGLLLKVDGYDIPSYNLVDTNIELGVGREYPPPPPEPTDTTTTITTDPTTTSTITLPPSPTTTASTSSNKDKTDSLELDGPTFIITFVGLVTLFSMSSIVRRSEKHHK